MKRRLLGVLVLSGAYLFESPPTLAQISDAQQQAVSPSQTGTSRSSQDVDLLRQDIRSKKKQWIAANLKLTESEATRFWPIYDQYSRELVKINDSQYALIRGYAQTWGSVSDDRAIMWIRRWLDLDTASSELRSKYVPIVRGVLPGKKAASFFQLDRRISLMIDFQLSAQIPLVQGRE